MSYRLRHEWVRGAVVNGAQLSVCEFCETLRVEPDGPEYYIRRCAEGAPTADRVVDTRPPCIAPARGGRLSR